jgi:PAS domain S-box-containing protein
MTGGEPKPLKLKRQLKTLQERVAELEHLESELETKDKYIEQRLRFQRTVVSISSRFVGVKDFDDAINTSLEEIGTLSKADRAYIFLFNDDGTEYSNSHEWCAAGVKSQIENLQYIPAKTTPWWVSQLEGGNVIHIVDVDDMPEDAKAEQQILQSQDIRSLIVLPITTNERLASFIGFDDVKNTGEWNSDDLNILVTASEIIGNALMMKWANDTIHHERSMAQRYFDMAPIFMLALDHNANILHINTKGCRILGCEREEAIGKNWFEHFVPDPSQDDVKGIFKRMISGEVQLVQNVETPIVTREGKIRIIAWYNSLLKDDEGKIKGTLSSGEDITERKKSEDRITRKPSLREGN